MDSILAELECPVCVEYMLPPIRQCIVGHCICDNCFKRLDKCPTCRQDLDTDARCFLLEKLQTKLEFPCTNRSNGCRSAFHGNKLKSHESSCNFFRTTCPLMECTWRGLFDNLAAHCATTHPQNYIAENSRKFKCDGLLKTPDLKEILLLFLFGKVFKCVFYVDGPRLCFGMCQIGFPTEERKFQFAIELENFRNGNGFIYDDICPVLSGDEEDMFKYRTFLMSPSSIEKTCKENTYIVTIAEEV